MARKPLEVNGDNAHLYYADAGTLSLAGVACGTLTAGTLTSGVFGDGFLAVDTTSMHELSSVIDITANEVEVAEVPRDILTAGAKISQPAFAPDYGEVSAELPYNASVSTMIGGFITNRTRKFFAIVPDDFTVPSTEWFLGYVKKWPPAGKEYKKGERVVCDLTLKIDGIAAFTAGS